MKKYALFVGRYQPLHAGHVYLFEQKISQNIPVCIAIRDVEKDEKNPFTSEQVKFNIERELNHHILTNMLKVIIIPDIESICYGRDVGYKIEQLEVPKEISEISATKIRKEMGL